MQSTEIGLDLESFAVVKAQKPRHRWSPLDAENPPPRWVQQLNNLRLRPDPKVCAILTVEHGLPFGFFDLWDSYWSGELSRVEKTVGKKTCFLELDLCLTDERGNLHGESSPALISKDHKSYWLRGIPLDDPKWVLTPPEQQNPVEVLQVRNADLRRELMRRIGVERFLGHLFSRTIDQQGDYTLLEVLLGERINSACKYLKMLNPSIGVWHMEGVPNDIQTVEEALKWRNEGWFVNAEVIT